MNSFISLSFLEWVKLAGGLLLFCSPGYNLVAWFSIQRPYDVAQKAVLSFCLSLSLWAVLLAWFQAFHLPIASWVIVLFFLINGLFVLKKFFLRLFSVQNMPPGLFRWESCLIYLIFLLIIGTGLWSLRNVVAAPGSDGYHHTLITRMIMDQGAIPNDYLPYAPLVSFTYHYAFHAAAAAISILGSLDPVKAIPIFGQVLMAFSAWSVYFFTKEVTDNRKAALVAAIFAGLISVFPAYLINWGRFTQITGMVLLPVFLASVLQFHPSFDRRGQLFITALLAAGIALAHYRITSMAAIGLLILLPASRLFKKGQTLFFKKLIIFLIKITLVSLLLGLPWIIHLIKAESIGFPANLGVPGPTYFSLSRLGESVLLYPTNWVFLASAVFPVLFGFWKKDRVIIGLSVWSGFLLLLSRWYPLSMMLDTISVVIFLSFPFSVMAGWAWTVGLDLTKGKRLGNLVLIILLLIFTGQGVLSKSSIVDPQAPYVLPEDLVATDWIKANIPESAYFMVNTFHWDFNPNYVVGSDAGYWLPLLAQRRTITLPMTYAMERLKQKGYSERLVEVDHLKGDLTTERAHRILEEEGVTHVFIGGRGGPIRAEQLLATPAYRLLYQKKNAYVFAFLKMKP